MLIFTLWVSVRPKTINSSPKLCVCGGCSSWGSGTAWPWCLPALTWCSASLQTPSSPRWWWKKKNLQPTSPRPSASSGQTHFAPPDTCWQGGALVCNLTPLSWRTCREGVCKQMTFSYALTDTPGMFTYYSASRRLYWENFGETLMVKFCGNLTCFYFLSLQDLTLMWRPMCLRPTTMITPSWCCWAPAELRERQPKLSSCTVSGKKHQTKT